MAGEEKYYNSEYHLSQKSSHIYNKACNTKVFNINLHWLAYQSL